MSKKSKPRHDFSPIIDIAYTDEDVALFNKKGIKFIKLDPEAINTIEKNVNLKFNKELKDKLSTAILKYKAGKVIVDDRPRVSEQRAALEQIYQLSRQLKDALENCDSDTRIKLILDSDWIDLKQTIFSLENIYNTTHDLLEKIPKDKGGKPSQMSLKLLIQDLAAIFNKDKGKDASVAFDPDNKQFYSPFFSFVKLTLTEIDDPPFSNNSLGRAIQRALEKSHS